MAGGGWKDAGKTLETFKDTKGYNSAGALLISTREGETSAGPDDDHDFSRKQMPEPVTTHHEYEAKSCMVYILGGLDGFPSWILHSGIAKQSRAKQIRA